MAYAVTLLLLVSIASLAGMGLNLQWGLAGLVNFGVVGFVAVGAYATALLTPHVGWAAAMAAAAGLCAALSAVLALLSIRLDGDYLAVITLGFGEVVRLLLLNEGWLTGGPLGIAGIQRPLAGLVPPGWDDAAQLGFGAVLGGRKLRLFVEDEETSATASVVATRKLLEANKVVMVGGFWGSPPALAAKPLILAANRVQLVSCSAVAVTDGDTRGLLYRFQAASNQWGSPCVKMAQSVGAKKVAVLAQQNPFVISIVDSFKAE